MSAPITAWGGLPSGLRGWLRFIVRVVHHTRPQRTG
jgi:hypothetical protein